MKNTNNLFSPRSLGRNFIGWVVSLGILTVAGIVALTTSGVNPTTDFSPVLILIAHAPSLAALGTALFVGGMRNAGALLKQIGRWRFGLSWYALAILGPLLIVLLSNMLSALMGQPPDWTNFFDTGALVAGLGPLFAGSLGEEIGWRGFAQPLLQQRYSALGAAVIVGFIWATWHLWPVLAPGGAADFTSMNVAQTYIRLISTSIVYAWLYNSTRGSLLIVMLAHAAHNIAIDLMPLPEGNIASMTLALLYAVTAAVVIYMSSARSLSSDKH